MNERCCRCHAILTSEDKQYYGCSCNECENDLRYEEWEQPVKSAYWRWRAICYCLRWLWNKPQTIRGIRLHRLPQLLDDIRSKRANGRR